MGMKVVKRYFSYSVHLIFLKLYRNNGLGTPTMGCDHLADSSTFGIRSNYFEFFLTDFRNNLHFHTLYI